MTNQPTPNHLYFLDVPLVRALTASLSCLSCFLLHGWQGS